VPNNVIENINIEFIPTETNSYVFDSEAGTLIIKNLNVHALPVSADQAKHLFKSATYGSYYLETCAFDRKPITEGTLTSPLALSSTSNNLANFNGGKPCHATEMIVSATIPSGSYSAGQELTFYGYHAILKGGQNGYEHEMYALIEDDNGCYITARAYDDHKTTTLGGVARNGVEYQFAVKIRFMTAQTLSADKTITLRVVVH
jgi:hypothetical protein